MKPISVLTIAFLAFILFLTACGGPSVATNKRPQFISSTPENGATDVDTGTTLTWKFIDPENDVLTYEVLFGESKINTKSVYKGPNSSYRQELEPNKTYYWKVIADDGNNKTDSDWLSFSTKKINRAPEKPELWSPYPSSQNVDYTQVVFQWKCTDPDQDPLKFELYLDGSFLATTTNYQYTKYNLQPSKTYTWFVKAFDGQYISQSDPATFTTAQAGQNRAPYVPKVISPPDGAQSVNIPVRLEWECSDPDQDPLSFEVYLNGKKKTTTSQFTFSLGDLSPNTTYSWYVIASDGTAGTIGPTWTFTTKGLTNRPPSTPTNPSPENNASVFETDVLLSWVSSDPDEDLLFYDLYFGESSNPPLIRQNLSSSNMLIQNLEKNKKYYWKVVAKDGNTSTEGPVWNFYTGTQTTYSKLLALCEDGIYEIDFTQTPTKTKISTITGNDFFYYEKDIFVIGSEFSIISESSVATASFAGNNIWVDTLVPIQKIVAGEIFACITNDSSLLILSVSDQSIDERSSLPLNQPSSLFVLGQYIYVCDSDGLKKFDAVDPSNPILKGTFPCTAKDLYIVDNTVYLLSDSKVIKLSSNDLSEIKSTDFTNGKKIYFDSGFVYALSDQKLVKFDEQLSQLKEIDLSNASSIVVSGSYIYVATQQGIQVFDINLEQSKSLDLIGIKEILLLR